MYFPVIRISSRIIEHNIGAACGGWWAGWVNQCGAPNGYMVVDVDGERVKWHYKATRRDFSYQFRIYNKGEFTAQSSLVPAVWYGIKTGNRWETWSSSSVRMKNVLLN